MLSIVHFHYPQFAQIGNFFCTKKSSHPKVAPVRWNSFGVGDICTIGGLHVLASVKLQKPLLEVVLVYFLFNCSYP